MVVVYFRGRLFFSFSSHQCLRKPRSCQPLDVALPGGSLGHSRAFGVLAGPVRSEGATDHVCGQFGPPTPHEAPLLLQPCLNEDLMTSFERKSYIVENALPNLNKARHLLEDVDSPEGGENHSWVMTRSKTTCSVTHLSEVSLHHLCSFSAGTGLSQVTPTRSRGVRNQHL